MAMTGYLVRTVNVPLLTGESVSDEMVTRWHKVNAVRVGVIVKESIRGIARDRFEATVHAKIQGLGSEIVAIEYVEDDVTAAHRPLHFPGSRGTTAGT